MAEIPSDIVSSAVQASIQARETMKERETRRSDVSNAANRQARSVDETDTSVDTTDADTQVYADSEGTGSQGRSMQTESSDEEGGTGPSPPDGITADDNGTTHVDIEA